MEVCRRAALEVSRRFLLLSTDSGTAGSFLDASALGLVSFFLLKQRIHKLSNNSFDRNTRTTIHLHRNSKIRILFG